MPPFRGTHRAQGASAESVDTPHHHHYRTHGESCFLSQGCSRSDPAPCPARGTARGAHGNPVAGDGASCLESEGSAGGKKRPLRRAQLSAHLLQRDNGNCAPSSSPAGSRALLAAPITPEGLTDSRALSAPPGWFSTKANSLGIKNNRKSLSQTELWKQLAFTHASPRPPTRAPPRPSPRVRAAAFR